MNDMEDKDVVSGLGIASLEDVEKKLDQEKFLETGNSTHAVGDVFLGCRSYEELAGTTDKLSVPLEETLLLTFVLEDAYEKLEDEEIESFFVLSFGIDEEDETVNMGYSEFYFDKNWSEEKFR